MLLLAIIAQNIPDGDSGNLLGIAAVITAIGGILAVLRSYLKKPDDDSELAEDAHHRIRLLKDTIEDLDRSLQQCRSERQVMTAEGKLKDMHIGTLEGRLADARRKLEECEREHR